MKKTVLIEGILLFVISLVGMAEGLRLIIQIDPKAVSDVLGPGFYVLFLSIALMTTGVVHIIINYRKDFSLEKVAVSKEMRIRMISMIVVLAVYIFLINITGYLMATTFFFLLEFRIIGIKSWPINIILTIVLTAVYYLVFVQYCSMVFPRGIFLNTL